MNEKIVVIASGGGHFREAMRIVEKLPFKPILISYKAGHIKSITGEYSVRFLAHPQRNIYKFIINLIQAIILSVKIRPKIVISTGADVTVAFCIISRILGSKLIYIESGANISKPTITGRILYPFANLFIVQWEEMLRHFPKAVYGGGPLL
jgi:UDP-N-acetylglucosamine:LPS N-acetylglucosamine transferase